MKKILGGKRADKERKPTKCLRGKRVGAEAPNECVFELGGTKAERSGKPLWERNNELQCGSALQHWNISFANTPRKQNTIAPQGELRFCFQVGGCGGKEKEPKRRTEKAPFFLFFL